MTKIEQNLIERYLEFECQIENIEVDDFEYFLEVEDKQLAIEKRMFFRQEIEDIIKSSNQDINKLIEEYFIKVERQELD